MNTENNKIIAEFMGLSYSEKYQFEGWYKNHEHNERVYELLYHSDWNWLMKVVEKIESLEFVVTICYLLTEITNEDLGQRETPLKSEIITISCNNGGTKIQTVYNAVIDFIKWYNEQNK